MEPNPIIVAATAKHTATLIFLHGLGDTGHGWASTIAAIRGPHVKVICPTASTMPVTLNAGFRMPSWFDLRTLDATAPEDEEGIMKATGLLHALISEEIRSGVPASRILLGGFSQGGALALHAGLTYIQPLAGIMSLSCWLPRHASFPDAVKVPLNLPDTLGPGSIQIHPLSLPILLLGCRRNLRLYLPRTLPLSYSYNTEIFQAHGDCDPVVPYKWGQMTASFLKTFMKNIEFHTYQGLTHSSSDAELKDMRAFIERTLPSASSK